MSQHNVIGQSIRGNVHFLDPKSKLIITLVMVIGVSISIEIYQVFFFTLMLIPILILYRPDLNVLKRIIVFFPLLIILTLFMLIAIQHPLTLKFFSFEKTYSPHQFILLSGFRFLVSVMHSSILLESEVHKSDLIDALTSFKLTKPLVSLLLLVNRMVNRLQEDYNKMLLAAKTRGIAQFSTIKGMFFKLRIMGRLLTRATKYSEIIGHTLSARGFTGNFTPTARGWTSEGISTAIVTVSFSSLIISLPFWI